jgi:hypothetical protein
MTFRNSSNSFHSRLPFDSNYFLPWIYQCLVFIYRWNKDRWKAIKLFPLTRSLFRNSSKQMNCFFVPLSMLLLFFLQKILQKYRRLVVSEKLMNVNRKAFKVFKNLCCNYWKRKKSTLCVLEMTKINGFCSSLLKSSLFRLPAQINPR